MESCELELPLTDRVGGGGRDQVNKIEGKKNPQRASSFAV